MQGAGELQHMQAALTRATADTYHKLDPLGHGPLLRDLQDQRTRKREDFSNQFLSLLHQHEMFKHSSTFLAVCPPPLEKKRKEKKRLRFSAIITRASQGGSPESTPPLPLAPFPSPSGHSKQIA